MSMKAKAPLPIGVDGLTYYQRYYRKHMMKRRGEALARWRAQRMSPEDRARYNAYKRKCHRKLMQDPARRSARQASQRLDYQRHKARYRARNARIARTPEQYGRQALHYAVLAGAIQRAPNCQLCAAPTKTHAHHHKGYAGMAIFDVQWLCRACHGLAHRKYKD